MVPPPIPFSNTLREFEAKAWSQALRIPENETHSKPLSKRIENVSLATLSSHLKGGVHDRSFKQHPKRVLSVRLYATPHAVLEKAPPEDL
jgi:hypothetical protein